MPAPIDLRLTQFDNKVTIDPTNAWLGDIHLGISVREVRIYMYIKKKQTSGDAIMLFFQIHKMKKIDKRSL